MLRTLTHYWRINLAVVFGAAVAAAVLTGALIVGDSVRGSLRDLTLDRLGRIDAAILADRFFGEALAERLPTPARLTETPAVTGATPAIFASGSATHADSGARASGIAVLGIDERFAALFDDAPELPFDRAAGQTFPSVVLNRSLADELGAATGDAVVLGFGGYSAIPRDTLMGDTDADDLVRTLRLNVRAVIPDTGPGRFGLQPRQQTPLNAYVALPRLQRALDLRGRVNTILLETDADDPATMEAVALQGALRRAARLDDLGLTISSRGGFATIESDEFVLRPGVEATVARLLDERDLAYRRTQSYLANTLRAGAREVPYALVAALDPLPGSDLASLRTVDGTEIDTISDDAILLGRWAAEQLGARIGDRVDVVYYVVGPQEELREDGVSLTVAAILADEGAAADASLTPDYPGIAEAEDIAAWDPPFPVDLDRIRPVDEAYWDERGATPKAFVSEALGRRLWRTRYGSTTSIRFEAREGSVDEVKDAIRREVSPESFGLAARALKGDGLRAARGATDFAGLFVGFSLFLIVAAALLVGLLFRLGVDRRAPEIGLLLAVGYRPPTVRRRLLAEAIALAAAGIAIGIVGAIGYAWLMLFGLRTVWLPAVGSSELSLHVTPATLAIGAAASMVVVVVFVHFAVRRLTRIDPRRLLSGETTERVTRAAGRIARTAAWGGLVLGVGIVAWGFASHAAASPMHAFGAGVSLLVGGLAAFTVWCRRPRHRLLNRGSGTLALAARNTSWNPPRSILSTTLVATAVFVIAVVASSRDDPGHDAGRLDSGAGGFELFAESDIAIHGDLEKPETRYELGFHEDGSAALDGVDFVPMRRVPGDDASCLNLYRPERPRLLGVPDELIRRGGFRFQQTLPLEAHEQNAWALLDRTFDDGAIPAIADFNSAMWILKVGLGDELELQDEYGRPLRIRLVALLASSVFQSDVLLHERDLLEHFPSRSGHAAFLIDVASDRAIDVSTALESTLAPFGFDATSTPAKLAAFKVVEHTYLATFQMLGGLGLLLGTVGLGVILLRNVIERRSELATLRAFGFKRRRLASLVVTENALLLVIGTAIGAGAALLAAAPRLATIEVPWGALTATLAVVVLVGLASSAAAMRVALRTPLLPALKADR